MQMRARFNDGPLDGEVLEVGDDGGRPPNRIVVVTGEGFGRQRHRYVVANHDPTADPPAAYGYEGVIS
jgi:hypothetical protein